MSTLSRLAEPLRERYLKLYPVEELRNAFPEVAERTKDAVAEAIVANNSAADVFDFGFSCFGCCKQYVHVYSHGLSSSSSAPTTLIDDSIYNNRKDGQERCKYDLLIKQRYTVVLKDQNGNYGDDTIDFLWPLHVVFEDDHMIAKIVKLSKNVRSYFPNHEVIRVDATYTERNILKEIELRLQTSGGWDKMDLTPGMKALWDQGFMDATKARYNEPDSSHTVAMDENFTLREKRPDEYEEIKNLGFRKTVFKVVDSEHAELKGMRFSVDPEEGEVNFPTYSDDPAHTDEVVEKIIASC